MRVRSLSAFSDNKSAAIAASEKAAISRQESLALVWTAGRSRLGVRPKIDFLRIDPTREVIHVGLSSTVGVV